MKTQIKRKYLDFGTDARQAFCNAITAIPSWKRFLICLLNYKQWSLARAYSKCCVHQIKYGCDDGLAKELLTIQDEKWAELYNINLNKF